MAIDNVDKVSGVEWDKLKNIIAKYTPTFIKKGDQAYMEAQNIPEDKMNDLLEKTTYKLAIGDDETMSDIKQFIEMSDEDIAMYSGKLETVNPINILPENIRDIVVEVEVDDRFCTGSSDVATPEISVSIEHSVINSDILLPEVDYTNPNVLKNSVDLSTIKTDRDTRLATGLDLTGKKLFTDKGKIFDIFIKGYGIIMDYGANKYAYANFEEAPFVYEDVLNCLLRHLSSYKDGETIDPESKQLHLGHIIARSAIAVMKAARLSTKTNPDATRFIGWDADAVEAIINVLPDQTIADKLYSFLRPKHIPFTAHVTTEMISAVAESPYFEIKDKYTLESWCKSFELLLISFLISNINGETDEDRYNHAKILLWVAINIYYHDSKINHTKHNGYYND